MYDIGGKKTMKVLNAIEHDSRQRLRVYCDADVRVSTADKRLVKGKMRDVGLNSLYLYADDTENAFLIEGEPVQVTIGMRREGSKLSIDLDGSVARMDDGGFVVQFTKSMRWWPVFIIFPSQQAN